MMATLTAKKILSALLNHCGTGSTASRHEYTKSMIVLHAQISTTNQLRPDSSKGKMIFVAESIGRSESSSHPVVITIATPVKPAIKNDRTEEANALSLSASEIPSPPLG